MSIKFVIITRHYPPEVSGGARRPSLMTKALRELGHSVKIISPFHLPEDSDAIQIVHPVRSISEQESLNSNPAKNARPTSLLRNAIRQWALWPEPDIRWAKKVMTFISSTDLEADWLLTTSPPESLHCIGREAAKVLNAKWIAECRDTWISNPHREILERSKFRKSFETRIAKNAFKGVDAVTAVSEAVMEDIRLLLPPNVPEQIIGHFSEPSTQSYNFNNQNINLVHAGGFSLSDRRRKLKPLLEAIKRSNKENLHLHILGPLAEEEINLLDHFNTFTISAHGQLSFDLSRAMQASADALILCTPNHSHALPGKFAEYSTTGLPILFQGNGSWLDLVEDKERLIPIEIGLKSISKNDRNLNPNRSYFSAHSAAELLSDFCAKLL